MFKNLKKSKLAAILGAAAVAMSLQAASAGAATKLRLGHVFAINSPVDQASQDFAKLVKERTKGEVEITVFPNSQIGGDESLARDLARGSLDLAFINPGSLSGLDPLLDIHYLPYIVTSFDEADKIFYNPNGILQKTLRETMVKHRMQPLGFFELEFRAVTNSKHAVEKPADLQGLKLRVPGSAGIRDFFIAAGAQAVAMPFPELFTALQQGTVDGQDNGASINRDRAVDAAAGRQFVCRPTYQRSEADRNAWLRDVVSGRIADCSGLDYFRTRVDHVVSISLKWV